MAFNRLADAAVDAQNPRTRDRALPRGLVSQSFTLGFIIVSSLAFFLAASQLNRLALMLSPLALAVVLGYSYAKRFTWASHLVLGAALGLAPVAGWIAVRGDLAPTPLVLGLGGASLGGGFRYFIRAAGRGLDRQAGLHSLPVRLGRARAMALARRLHLAASLGFLLTGWLAGLGWLYYVAALAAGLLLWWEHRLLSPQDLTRLNHSFFTLNGTVSLVLGLATLFSVWP